MPPRKQKPNPPALSDPVEWARHFWEQQHLEGDEQRFLAMGALLRYQRIVVDTLEEVLRGYKLNITDYLVLMTLQMSETGTRLISDLSKRLMVHPTTATLATDRLEAKALLFRAPHPTDRRATCVSITHKGTALAREATVALDEVHFGLVGASTTDVGKLMTVLKSLRAAAGDTGRSRRTSAT
jgi:DNA-binding MarR family transcriptional regulator